MDAHVYALRSWTIKKKGEEFLHRGDRTVGHTPLARPVYELATRDHCHRPEAPVRVLAPAQ
jgi:hypothetical protein